MLLWDLRIQSGLNGSLDAKPPLRIAAQSHVRACFENTAIEAVCLL